jgi:hypothetical protein
MAAWSSAEYWTYGGRCGVTNAKKSSASAGLLRGKALSRAYNRLGKSLVPPPVLKPYGGRIGGISGSTVGKAGLG